MKRFNSFFLIFATLTLAGTLLWSCQEKSNIPSPGDNAFNLTDEPSPVVDAIDVTVDSALLIIDHLNDGETTTEKYRIRGIVSKNITSPTDIPSKYTDINIVIKDGGRELTCYYTKDLRNKNFTSMYKVPLVGSELTLVGPLQKYVNKSGDVKPEMVKGFIESYQKGIFTINPDSLPACPDPEEGQILAGEALEIGNALGLGETTPETYDILGVVCSIDEAPSTQYKNATFRIQDNTKKQFYCFRVKKNNGEAFTNPDELAVGDIVVIRSKIMKYNKDGGIVETPQNAGNIIKSNNPNFNAK